MTTYILLRSNKEMGPFSLKQMGEMGLKTDDLIWVEGQSASWRNPHEINELRTLVVSASKSKPGSVEKETRDIRVNPEEEPKRQAPQQKHIFVALPADPGKKPEVLETEPVLQAPDVLKDPREYIPVEKPKDEIETKYAMSLDEIKERYVKTLESRRNKTAGLSLEIPRSLKNAAVYVGVFILGAVIVLLLMKPERSGPVAGEQIKLPVQFEERQPADDVIATNSDLESDVMLPESYYDSQSSAEVEELKPSAESSKHPAVKKKPVINVENDAADPVAEEELDHKTSLPKNEVPEIRSVTASEIADQVSVKTNSYTIAALGGIRDLEITIRNGSDFILDKVTVEVRYLNPKGEIVKTEDINFKSIQPNGTQTMGMKKSTRGVKVSHRIIRIESKEIGTHTAGN